MALLRDPKRTVCAINNKVTVSLPLTQIDVKDIANKINIEDLADVDIETYGKNDGVVLVYDSNTAQWQSTVLLDRQQMDAGEY